MGDFNLDTRELIQALEQYQEATNKDMAEVLNRAGRNVAFKAIRYTPTTLKSDITASLETMVAWQDGHQVPLKYLIANAFRRKRGQPPVAGSRMRDAVDSLYALRYKTIGYVKAGWLNAARAFGGAGKEPFSKGLASLGYGKKATAFNLNAELANFSRGANLVGSDGLQRAIDETARDMIAFADKKMAATAKKHSA